MDFRKLESVAAVCPGVIPAVAQDIETGRILMLGYVNREALETALTEKRAVFWSTSRNELWIKGRSSGDELELMEVRVNCEQNSVLYLVRPLGEGACHTLQDDGRHRDSCYYRVLEGGVLRHAPYEPIWR